MCPPPGPPAPPPPPAAPTRGREGVAQKGERVETQPVLEHVFQNHAEVDCHQHDAHQGHQACEAGRAGFRGFHGKPAEVQTHCRERHAAQAELRLRGCLTPVVPTTHRSDWTAGCARMTAGWRAAQSAPALKPSSSRGAAPRLPGSAAAAAAATAAGQCLRRVKRQQGVWEVPGTAAGTVLEDVLHAFKSHTRSAVAPKPPASQPPT